MLTTILFDLDGTLLPMDQDVFVRAYFERLVRKAAPYGYDPTTLVQTIWAGTAAMVQNNGSASNEALFWRFFAEQYGADALADKAVFDAFYREEFDEVQAVCGFTPMARICIDRLRDKGYRMALATNPIFPRTATEARIRWAGLDPADFAWITTYENSTRCKPNPDYYREVADKLRVSPAECLMVGNDVEEDMIAQACGMQVFLLTDCLINKNARDLSAYPHGDFAAWMAYCDRL